MNTSICTRCRETITTPAGYAKWVDAAGFQMCGFSSVAGAHVPATR